MLLLLSSITICLEIEQFVLVPVILNNNSLVIQSVKQQEFPKCQPLQTPKYQIVSLRKEKNKNSFAKADSSVDKVLFCTRKNLSISQTLNLHVVETGAFPSNFAEQLRRRHSSHFT